MMRDKPGETTVNGPVTMVTGLYFTFPQGGDPSQQSPSVGGRHD